MVGSDSEDLAFGLNGSSSSGLRALPASLPWLHLFSLTVANVDIHLRFSPFNKLSLSPSLVPGTQKIQVGVLHLRPTLSGRDSIPLPSPWKKGFGVFMLPRGLPC